MNLIRAIRSFVRKNATEIKLLCRFGYPAAFYGTRPSESLDSAPIFVFHEVDTPSLEHKLKFLYDNGYETLSLNEWFDCIERKESFRANQVLLTFDDGHISLWRDAYPLLKKYGYKATSFICPGLVPFAQDSKRDGRKLCNWDEIKRMHLSGTIDFQAHGLAHDLVFTSSRLIGFYSPHFASHYMGPGDKAFMIEAQSTPSITIHWPYPDDAGQQKNFGLPIFDLKPRFAASTRYSVDTAFLDHFRAYISDNGGVPFFANKDYERLLRAEFRRIHQSAGGRLVTGQSYARELAHDLSESRAIIEKMLPDKHVEHFCVPWFRASKVALSSALAAGYKTAFLGADTEASKRRSAQDIGIKPIARYPDYYIHALPGKGRQDILRIFAGKFRQKFIRI